MARIAIFCDGTWNSPTQDQPTHVHRMFQATLRASKKTSDQQCIYVTGVGATGGDWSTVIGKGLHKVGGGAFGWGLNANIIEAYQKLVAAYSSGDQIFIFGFSRGAYTARSLAGMIRKVGIIDNPTPARLQEAFEVYRRPGADNGPDKESVLKDRARLSPRFATSTDDIDWRAENPLEDGPRPVPDLVTVAYLGIWDTVGSLGIPTSILGPVAAVWNRKYQFHDTKLSRMVKSARHAVALDERRVFYRPSLWDNLEQNPEGPGLNGGDRSEKRPYQQVWFAGTHSILGGSAQTRALTSITLDWVAEGARQLGLQIADDPPLLDHDPDPTAHSDELMDAPLLYRLAGALLDWRKGPGHPVDMHPSVAARLAGRPEYRPVSLKALKPELFGGAPHAPAPKNTG